MLNKTELPQSQAQFEMWCEPPTCSSVCRGIFSERNRGIYFEKLGNTGVYILKKLGNASKLGNNPK